ncbi:hypothetical protein [Parasedimentitalea psychrophila]|uniref:Uncharacterized protein n=1 Tax=Parasedimentitalea psychrophila TaxID=2997337 RepID=A0A9Y2P106_9RHOB|nr:hypothetical protein [Parasedimentitalea psychrophila]WIY23672.1 hypothetical protein QPJ95_13550 [Parasedimentitalea psychrophila]
MQSNAFFNKNKAVGSNSYQDIGRTPSERDTRSFGSTSHNLTKENTGAAATAPGVNQDKKTASFRRNKSPKRVKSAMSLYAKDRHKKVAKGLGFALTLGTESAWHGLTVILIARLSEAERVSLAFVTLNSLSEKHAYMTASAALFGTLYGEAAE